MKNLSVGVHPQLCLIIYWSNHSQIIKISKKYCIRHLLCLLCLPQDHCLEDPVIEAQLEGQLMTQHLARRIDGVDAGLCPRIASIDLAYHRICMFACHCQLHHCSLLFSYSHLSSA